MVPALALTQVEALPCSSPPLTLASYECGGLRWPVLLFQPIFGMRRSCDEDEGLSY